MRSLKLPARDYFAFLLREIRNPIPRASIITVIIIANLKYRSGDGLVIISNMIDKVLDRSIIFIHYYLLCIMLKSAILTIFYAVRIVNKI